MKVQISPLEKTVALHLGQVLAHQEQIIKMLSEIIANDSGREFNDVCKGYITDARNSVPATIINF
jgi:hypothetical protein